MTVDDGIVGLTGRVDERADIRMIVRLCRSVDGVVALHESIEYELSGTELTEDDCPALDTRDGCAARQVAEASASTQGRRG